MCGFGIHCTLGWGTEKLLIKYIEISAALFLQQWLGYELWSWAGIRARSVLEFSSSLTLANYLTPRPPVSSSVNREYLSIWSLGCGAWCLGWHAVRAQKRSHVVVTDIVTVSQNPGEGAGQDPCGASFKEPLVIGT